MNNKNTMNSSKILIILIILHGTININLINSNFWYSNNIVPIHLPPIFTIIGNILFIVYIFVIKRVFEYRDKELRLKDTIIKLKESNEIISYLRTHKHDFFNHLQIIRGLAQTKNCGRIIPYIDSIVGSVGSTYKIANIDIPEIAVVIMQKVGEATNKSINTNVEINTDLSGLKGNPLEYSQILFNLIDNAITALDKQEIHDKFIEIIIDEGDRNYYFIIENNLPIIPKEYQPKIFDKGFTTKTGDGGMGLFIVKSLVKKNKGDINLISEEGLGTIFEISFPKP